MNKIIALRSPGGPEQLELVRHPVPAPGAGAIVLRQTAIGVNFIDVYQRTGLYPLAARPAVVGVEAVGVVAQVGAGVEHVRVGDRVAYAGEPGAYAEARVLPAWRAVPVPAGLPDATAAVALARGITVQMLQSKVYPVARGAWVLVHSAAGGLGGLLTQWAKRRGATVVGTVGSPAKAELARAAGADHVIVGRDADFAAEVAAITGGRGVDVAYDGVGGTTLRRTLGCVRPFGVVASYGQAAGPIPPLAVEELGPRRSLVLARPSVMHYMAAPEVYRAAAREVFAEGLYPALGRAYPLADAAQAHRDLEAGATVGACYLAVES